MLDYSEPLSPEDAKHLTEFIGKKRIVVLNKSDLPKRIGGPEDIRAIEICCISGKGIETLKDAIQKLVWGGEIRAEMLEVMINARHQEALSRARSAIQRGATGLRGEAGLELVALELREATNAVGEIVGKTTTEDLLDSIFSQFCIGK